MSHAAEPTRVRAVFDPARRDDLIPEAQALIGRVCDWRYLWVVEETELGGAYSGERAYAPDEDTSPTPYLVVPESDLRVIERLGQGGARVGS